MQEKKIDMNSQSVPQATLSARNSSGSQDRPDVFANRSKAVTVSYNAKAPQKFTPQNSSNQGRRSYQPKPASRPQSSSFGPTKFHGPKLSHEGHDVAFHYQSEQFMMAHCRFLMSASYDLRLHNMDPDYPVDWDAVRLVYQNTLENQTPRCPICLDEPRCARIAKCGHQYCWPCVVRYVRYIDWDEIKDEATANYVVARGKPKSKKCAICSKWVQLDNLKPVITCPAVPVNVGTIVKMKLMYRPPGSVAAIPVANMEEGVLDHLTRNHSKVRNITSIEERHMYATELLNLEFCSEEAMIDGPKEVLSICQELWSTVKSKMDALDRNDEESSQKSRKSSSSDSSPNTVYYLDAFEDCVKPNSGESASTETLGNDDTENAENEVFDESKYKAKSNQEYFYQSADGQHIYLYSLNWSCLMHEFVNVTALPQEISAQIVQIDSAIMTEEVRKRYRYLSHIPLLCAIQFVELKLNPPLVSAKTLKMFKHGLERREVARQKRQWLDKKQDDYINQQMVKQQEEMLTRQMRNVHVQPEKEVSFVKVDDFISLSTSSSSQAASSPPNTYAAKLNSFARVAMKPVGAPVSANKSAAVTSSSARVPSDNDSGDDETKRAFAPPPQQGFLARCSPSDFVVTRVKKAKKKR